MQTPVLGLAVQRGTDLDLGVTGVNDLLGIVLVHHLVTGYQQFAGLGMVDVICQVTTEQTLAEILDDTTVIHDGLYHDTLMGAAVLHADPEGA